jgi:tetratricopeptide (TPR) repeat protein
MVRLGLLQVGNGQSEPGLSALQEAWQDARTRQDRAQQLSAVVALGTAAWLLDRPNDARRYYEDGLHLAQQERDMALEATLRLRLTHIYSENGRVNDAIDSGKRALIISRTLRDSATEAAALSRLGDVYRKTGQTAEADESDQRALLLYSHRQTLVHGGR